MKRQFNLKSVFLIITGVAFIAAAATGSFGETVQKVSILVLLASSLIALLVLMVVVREVIIWFLGRVLSLVIGQCYQGIQQCFLVLREGGRRKRPAEHGSDTKRPQVD